MFLRLRSKYPEQICSAEKMPNDFASVSFRGQRLKSSKPNPPDLIAANSKDVGVNFVFATQEKSKA
jgi:hypothetical protein